MVRDRAQQLAAHLACMRIQGQPLARHQNTSHIHTEKQTGRQADRQTNRQKDRQTKTVTHVRRKRFFEVCGRAR